MTDRTADELARVIAERDFWKGRATVMFWQKQNERGPIADDTFEQTKVLDDAPPSEGNRHDRRTAEAIERKTKELQKLIEAKSADLKPGWLESEMKDIRACQRANRKILAAADAAKKNGHTQPTNIEFTQPELRAIAYMVLCSGLAE